ncbi:peptidase M24, structural domain-containing protein [Pavlovales sp. CCMP2436]|nr:peptidase M24, structural domain-containing protein [Pavlovales sp. CCMP2436]
MALDSCVFPEGTPGFVVDVLARRSLWEAGLDYQHGTGHGVGAALNVHEGPQSISARFGNTEPLAAGMILSNEPGFYDVDAEFGVRIENLLIVTKRMTQHNFGGKQFLGFERLTHVPIQRSLMAPELLSAEDVCWIDSYHAQVRKAVLPRVSGRAHEWLLAATEPLGSGFAQPRI